MSRLSPFPSPHPHSLGCGHRTDTGPTDLRPLTLGPCSTGLTLVPALLLPLKSSPASSPGPAPPPPPFWPDLGVGVLRGKPGSSWHMCKNSPGRRSSQIGRHSSSWGCSGNEDRQEGSACGLGRGRAVNGQTGRQGSVEELDGRSGRDGDRPSWARGPPASSTDGAALAVPSPHGCQPAGPPGVGHLQSREPG